MSAPFDREQLRRDLSDALKSIQQDHEVTGLDVLAAALTTLEGARTRSTAGCSRRTSPRSRGRTVRSCGVWFR
jgi:hypothetical protein